MPGVEDSPLTVHIDFENVQCLSIDKKQELIEKYIPVLCAKNGKCHVTYDAYVYWLNKHFTPAQQELVVKSHSCGCCMKTWKEQEAVPQTLFDDVHGFGVAFIGPIMCYSTDELVQCFNQKYKQTYKEVYLNK